MITMKKAHIFCIILAAIIIIVPLFYAEQIVRFVGKTALNAIFAELEREEKEDEIRIANGEPIYGRDTCLIWANTFEILEILNKKNLYIQTKKVFGAILEEITIYKKIDKKLYIVAKTGYAVIDEDAFCKIYVNDESLFEANDSTIERIEDDHIKYFSEYNSFSPTERDNFEKLEKQLEKRLARKAKKEREKALNEEKK